MVIMLTLWLSPLCIAEEGWGALNLSGSLVITCEVVVLSFGAHTAKGLSLWACFSYNAVFSIDAILAPFFPPVLAFPNFGDLY